jgi:hypothetical protein
LKRRIRKRKIVEELANEIEKCIGILIRSYKEISRKKSQLGVRLKVWSEKRNLKRSFVSTFKREDL